MVRLRNTNAMSLDPMGFRSTCTTIHTRASIAAADAATLLRFLPPLRKAQRVLVRIIGDLARTASYAVTAPELLPTNTDLIQPIVDVVPRRLEQVEAALTVMGKQLLRAAGGTMTGVAKLDETVLVAYEEFLQAQFALITAYSNALRMRKLFSNALEVSSLLEAIAEFDRAHACVMQQDDILGLSNDVVSTSPPQPSSSTYPPEKQGVGAQAHGTSSGTQPHPTLQAPAELPISQPSMLSKLPGSHPKVAYELPGSTRQAAPELPRDPIVSELPFPAATSNRVKTSSSSFMSNLGSKFKALTASIQPKPHPYVTTLCAAAASNDTAQMHGLLSFPSNPHPVQLLLNGLNESGETPLTSACAAGSLSAASFLLKHGADVLTANARGVPPLYMGDSPKFTSLLLKHGADPNARNARTGEPFFAAVVVKAATTESTSRTTDTGADELSTLRLLLKHGADPSTQDASIRTVLGNAVRAGNVEVVRLLLGHGAKAVTGDVRGLPIVGALLLPDAAVAASMVELLVSNGASVGLEVRCYNTGRGVTQLCVESADNGDGGKGTARLLEIVLGAGAGTPGERDVRGEKIWWRVVTLCDGQSGQARERGLRMARAFLDKGVVDLKETFSIGSILSQTALGFAMERGLWGLVALLVRAGAVAPELVTGKGGVSLGQAVKMGEGILALLDQDESALREKTQVQAPLAGTSEAGSSAVNELGSGDRAVGSIPIEAVPAPPGPPPGYIPGSDGEPEDAPPPYEGLPSR